MDLSRGEQVGFSSSAPAGHASLLPMLPVQIDIMVGRYQRSMPLWHASHMGMEDNASSTDL